MNSETAQKPQHPKTAQLRRVMLADDHTLLLEAFRKLLEPHFDVVGTAADGHALLEVAKALHPEVVVMDIAMPLLNGLEAARKLKGVVPGVKMVFLTMHEDPDLAMQAMREGASGYLLKTSAPAELLHAISQAIRGKSYVTPGIATRMQEAFIRDPQCKPHGKELTPRQREVLQLLAEGKSMKQVAAVLAVTPRTVAFHKYKMMEGLGVKTSAELIQFAIRNRVLVA
jgi:DNA-binding NarL/FixJ family response regulator